MTSHFIYKMSLQKKNNPSVGQDQNFDSDSYLFSGIFTLLHLYSAQLELRRWCTHGFVPQQNPVL